MTETRTTGTPTTGTPTTGTPTTETWPYLRVHQSRTQEPTPYAYKLAATLEEVFTAEGHELSDVVRGLNARKVRTPGGEPWTDESFRAEMKRLGA